MRVPARDLRQRGADPRHGPQGLRAGGRTSPRCPASSERSYAMPDAHWGYGFPIGGVAASTPTRAAWSRPAAWASTSPAACAACTPGCARADIDAGAEARSPTRSSPHPGGRRQHGRDPPRAPRRWTPCSPAARAGPWSAARASPPTSSASRSAGTMARRQARQRLASSAKKRQRDEMGTLGSRQPLSRGAGGGGGLRRSDRARPSACAQGDIVVMIHCGSRGLGHQIGTEFLKRMAIDARQLRHRAARPRAGLRADQLRRRPGVPGRHARGDQLRARQPPDPHASRARGVRATFCRGRGCRCSTTSRTTPARWRSTRGRRPRRLFVHRKGATRAFGPGHPDLPDALRDGGPAGADRRLDGHRLVRARRARARPRRAPSARPATAPAAR